MLIIIGTAGSREKKSHAGDLRSRGFAVIARGVARWGKLLVAGCWRAAGHCDPVYPDKPTPLFEQSVCVEVLNVKRHACFRRGAARHCHTKLTVNDQAFH